MKNNSKGGESMNDELKHFGVKGMKWGVRRTAAQLGHPTGKIDLQKQKRE